MGAASIAGSSRGKVSGDPAVAAVWTVVEARRRGSTAGGVGAGPRARWMPAGARRRPMLRWRAKGWWMGRWAARRRRAAAVGRGSGGGGSAGRKKMGRRRRCRDEEDGEEGAHGLSFCDGSDPSHLCDRE
jgi:hypothetical protein